MATRRRIQLELPKLDASEAQFRSALNDRMRRIQQALDDLDFPPAIQTVINTITQGTGLCVIQEVPEGTVDGTNREFTTTHEPSPALIWVQVGGLMMNPFDDYVLTADEGLITFNEDCQPRSGEEIWVWYFCGDAIPPAIGVGTARYFSGGTEAINYGNSATFNILDDLSGGVWAKFGPDTASNSALIGYGINSSSEGHPYLLQVTGSSNNWDIKWFQDKVPNTEDSITFNTNLSNDTWYYIGWSRDESALEVTIFIGDGNSILNTYTGNYSTATINNESGTSQLVVGNVGNPGAFPLTPPASDVTIQEHYIWTGTSTQADHEAAMGGNPPSSGLVLSVGPSLGDSPEIDDSGNGFTGAVTGTVIVAGHG